MLSLTISTIDKCKNGTRQKKSNKEDDSVSMEDNAKPQVKSRD